MSNAIRVLERKLGGQLLQRKPKIAPTSLAGAIPPYLQDIVEKSESVLACWAVMTRLQREHQVEPPRP